MGYITDPRGFDVRAMILAAGKGTRLGHLGADLPKCMLRLGDRPLLEWTIDRLSTAGISELVINLHHAPRVITDHFDTGSRWNVRIRYSYEDEPLGTAGAISNARALLGDSESFLVLYADTVLDWDPVPMIEDHYRNSPVCTIAVAQVSDPSCFGVVRFDANRRILEFIEKPRVWTEPQAWVNAGLYVLGPSIYSFLPPSGYCDFGMHVFPAMLSADVDMRAYRRPGTLRPVDTLELYQLAQNGWRVSSSA